VLDQQQVKAVPVDGRNEPFELAMGAVRADTRADETKPPRHTMDMSIHRHGRHAE
jgi:hypothetical protein